MKETHNFIQAVFSLISIAITWVMILMCIVVTQNPIALTRQIMTTCAETQIDMAPYCEKYQSHMPFNREAITNPFMMNDKVCATNGAIYVRVDPDHAQLAKEMCDFRFIEDEQKEVHAKYLTMVREVLSTGLEGSDKSNGIKVPQQDQVVRNADICVTCQGSGNQFFVMDEPVDKCPDCAGSGIYSTPRAIIKLGLGFYDTLYLHQLNQLGSTLFANHPKDPSYFKFEYGDGLLMPCSKGRA